MKPSTVTPSREGIVYVLKVLEARAHGNKSAYANSILDFWNLDQGEHRFQIHARVFKSMDLIGYLEDALQ